MLPHPASSRAVARVTLAVLAALLVAGRPAGAQPLAEYEVKAAFVYNFAKFTEWPAEAMRASSLRLCLVGPANDFAAALERLVDKPPVDGRPLVAARITLGTEVAACHVLVATAHDRVAADWLQRAAALPILTVGEAPGFAAGGGMVGLTLDGDRVRFEVNPAAVQRSGLRLSSQILRLARIVPGGTASPTPGAGASP